jgi:hypothetical protein
MNLRCQSYRPSPRKEQRNYRIDKRLADDLDVHCENRDLIRDRTVERALRLFLDATSEQETQTFVVQLSDEAAATMDAYRKVFLADRNALIEAALLEFIDKKLGTEVDQRAAFERLRSEVLARTSN